MSFTINVPRCKDRREFEDAVLDAKVSQKADARTKIGKLQNQLVDAGRDSLIEMIAYTDPAPPYSAKIQGRVNENLSGHVTVTLNLLIPEKSK